MVTPLIPDRRSGRDRRNATRQAISGRVELIFENPTPMAVVGELMDISATGFRALHASSALEPGVEVEYQRSGAAGRARVVWTQVTQDARVSGFVTL
ncbi:MAG TPA: hypothetical protein VIY49_37995 [Bryobacteraceae bacterium]